MIPISMKLVERPPSAAEIFKQITFGTAVGLTNTAKDAQKASVDAIKSTFTTRGTWFQQNMKHGIKITPATKANLQAAVHTLADWLEIHEKGGTKTPRGRNLTVPSFAIRPRGSRKIIRAAQRARALLASGKAFILDTPKGEVIARQRGRGGRLEVLYGLEPQVKIRRQSTFFDPIDRTVKRRLHPNIEAGIKRAFATMRK